MSAVLGLNHVTFAVCNLDRAIDFYTSGLGIKMVKKFDKGAYLQAGDLWLCLSLDQKTRNQAHEDYTHVAFDVSDSNFLEVKARLQALGAREWKSNKSEGESFYFLDPDHHKLEIHVGTLQTRLNSMGV